jgi:hypothetical protein
MASLETTSRTAGTILLAVLLNGSVLRSQTIATSTEKDRRDLAVTVYNSNLALVRDVRRLRLPSGETELHFEDVAAQVNPASTQMVSLTSPGLFTVFEQSYRYDLLSPEALLKKYVGKQVTLVRRMRENGSTKDVRVQAILLADNNGPVWKVGTEIMTHMAADRYVFARLPKNFYSRPTLVCLIANRGAADQTVATTYLTGGMNWKADYTFTIAPDETIGALSGWAAVSNDSGTTFKEARLQLVAGEVHRAATPRPMLQLALAKAAPQFEQQPFSEYHLYTLQRRATLINHSSLEIGLLHSAKVHFVKTFEVNGQSYYYRAQAQSGTAMNEPVQVRIHFKNSGANSLGVPLPAGTVRIYENDSAGRSEFIGEDQIRRTPKGGNLNLDVGNAFDVTASRRQTDYQALGPRSSEAAFEVAIRNHKPKPITVEVNEPMGGEWTMLESNFKYRKTSAFSVQFEVPVAANTQSLLKYRVRVHW